MHPINSNHSNYKAINKPAAWYFQKATCYPVVYGKLLDRLRSAEEQMYVQICQSLYQTTHRRLCEWHGI